MCTIHTSENGAVLIAHALESALWVLEVMNLHGKRRKLLVNGGGGGL